MDGDVGVTDSLQLSLVVVALGGDQGGGSAVGGGRTGRTGGKRWGEGRYGGQ
jgi:hypothetical protein